VDYGVEGQIGQSSYERYLDDLLDVWVEAERVLVPNGKLCINTPIVPVPKKVDNSTHTRVLKNLNNDIEFTILTRGRCSLQRYSLFIWQKQTSVKMFGSYPYPPNLYEDNTIEFINVYVKPGKPRSLPKTVKEGSKLTQEQWLNLTMQIWPIYPEDVSRTGGHPAPFPVKLPQRLTLMYTFAAVPAVGFPGDVVLDMFAGTGATCLAAKSTGRRFIGIDLNPEYCAFARDRLGLGDLPSADIRIPRVRLKLPKANDKQPLLFKEA
jgi:DNA modification methylase